ncbi:hypothetical protein L195_g064456, partial [Trifolium pratense]
ELVLDEGDGRCVADLVKEGFRSGWRSCGWLLIWLEIL